MSSMDKKKHWSMDWFFRENLQETRENLQETHGFDHKISGFPVNIFPSSNSLGYPVIHLCPSALDDIRYGDDEKTGI